MEILPYFLVQLVPFESTHPLPVLLPAQLPALLPFMLPVLFPVMLPVMPPFMLPVVLSLSNKIMKLGKPFPRDREENGDNK